VLALEAMGKLSQLLINLFTVIKINPAYCLSHLRSSMLV
jgi:hypothetical protein